MASEDDVITFPSAEPSMEPCGIPIPVEKSHSDLRESTDSLHNGSHESSTADADLEAAADTDALTECTATNADTVGSNGLLDGVNIPEEMLDMSQSMMDQYAQDENYGCHADTGIQGDRLDYGDTHTEQLQQPTGDLDSEPSGVISDVAPGHIEGNTNILHADSNAGEFTQAYNVEETSDHANTVEPCDYQLPAQQPEEESSDPLGDNVDYDHGEPDALDEHVDGSESINNICDDTVRCEVNEPEASMESQDNRFVHESTLAGEFGECEPTLGLEDKEDISESNLLSENDVPEPILELGDNKDIGESTIPTKYDESGSIMELGDSRDTCEPIQTNKDNKSQATEELAGYKDVQSGETQQANSEVYSQQTTASVSDEVPKDAVPESDLNIPNDAPAFPGDIIDPRDLVGLDIVRVTAVNSPSFTEQEMPETQWQGTSSADLEKREIASSEHDNNEKVGIEGDTIEGNQVTLDKQNLADQASTSKTDSLEVNAPSDPKGTTQERLEYCPNKSQKHELDKDLPNTVLQHKHGMFSCSGCGFSTRLNEAFRVHLLCHTFGALYMCMFCPTLTQEITQIRRHLEQAHPKQAVKFAHIVKPFIDKIMDALASCPDSDGSECGEEDSNEEVSVEKSSTTVASSTSPVAAAKVTRTKSTETAFVKKAYSPPILIDDNDSNDSTDLRKTGPSKKSEIVKTTKLECSFASGKFQCVTCVFETHSQEDMASHLYEHLHVKIGSSKPLCVRCDPTSPNSSHANCPVVHNMIMLLLKQKEQYMTKIREKQVAERRARQAVTTVMPTPTVFPGDVQIAGKQMILLTDTKNKPSTTSPRPVVLVGPAAREFSSESTQLKNKRHQEDTEAKTIEDDVIDLAGPDSNESQKIDDEPELENAKEDKPVEVEKPSHEPNNELKSDQPAEPQSKEDAETKQGKTLLSVITYEKGNYFCRKCKFKTKLPMQFRRHLWKDVHPNNQCNHCAPEILYSRLKYCKQLDALLDFVEQIKNGDQKMVSAFLKDSEEASNSDQSSVHGNLLSLRRTIGDDTLVLKPVIGGKEHVSKTFWLITDAGIVEMTDANDSGESDEEAELAEAIKATPVKFPKPTPPKKTQEAPINKEEPSVSNYSKDESSNSNKEEQQHSGDDLIGEVEPCNSQTDGSCDVMETDDEPNQTGAEEDLDQWEVSLADESREMNDDNDDIRNRSFEEVDKVIIEHNKRAESVFSSPENTPDLGETISIRAPVGDPVHVLSDDEEPIITINRASHDTDKTAEDTSCTEKKEGALDNRNIKEAMDMLIGLNDAQENPLYENQLESSSETTKQEEDHPDCQGTLNDPDESDHDDGDPGESDHDDGGSLTGEDKDDSDHDDGRKLGSEVREENNENDQDDGGRLEGEVEEVKDGNDPDDGESLEREEKGEAVEEEVLSNSGGLAQDDSKDEVEDIHQSEPAVAMEAESDEDVAVVEDDPVEDAPAVIPCEDEDKSAQAEEPLTSEPTSESMSVEPSRDQPMLFQCAIEECNGWKSDSQVSFKMHCLSKHYKESPMHCHCCILTFPDEDVLIEHIKIAHGPVLPYQCSVGSCKFASHIMHDFRSHLSVVHKNESSFNCSYCKSEFEDRESLINHMISNILKLHKCPCCAVVTPQIAVIRAHISAQHPQSSATYSQEIYVACRKMMGKTTASQSLFAVEQLTDADPDRPESPVIIDCDTIAATKPLILRPSTKNTNKESSQSFMCSCQYRSHDLLSILWHMKTCEENRRLTSTEGSTSILSKLPVLPTISRETSVEPVEIVPAPEPEPVTVEPEPVPVPEVHAEKPDEPEEIRPIVILPERKKLRKQILNTIEIVETIYDRLKPCKERQCSFCDFRTSFSVLSDAHQRLHKQRRDKAPADNYSCSSCPFHTQSIENLKAHMQNHTSLRTLKVFQCSLCPVQMTSMDGIENHLVESHPDDEFHFECKLQKLIIKCDPCEMSFKGETAYLDHLQKKHEDQLVQHVRDLYGIPIPPPSNTDPSGFCFLDESGDSDCIMEADSEYKPGKKTRPKKKSTARKHSHRVMSHRSPVDSVKLRRGSGEVASTSSQEAVKRSRSQTDGQMQCTSCDFTCDEIQPWKQHLQGHRLPGIRSICVFFCRTCDWPSNSKKLMLEHCQTEHVLSMDQARENGYEAQNVEINADLSQSDSSQGSEDTRGSSNTRLSMSIDRYHCDNCEFSTNDIQTYNAHMITHDDESANFLPLGGMSDDSQDGTPAESPRSKRKKYGSMAQLMKARQVDRDSFRFKCEDCPYATNTSKHYNAHVATHLKQQQIKNGFRCAYCSMIAVVAGNVTRHLRVYHPDKPLEMIPIKNGKPQDKSVIYPDLNTPQQPVKDLAPKVPDSGHKELAPVEDSYDYNTLKSNKGKAPASIRAELQQTQQEVRSLPLTLAKELENSGIKIPDESIFKTHLKCPKCDYSTKVRMSYIRHWKQHRAPGSPRPSLSTPRSPVGAFLNQLGIDADNMSREAAGSLEAMEDDGMVVDEDVSEEDEGDEEEEDEDEEGKASKPKYTPEMVKFCKKVLNKDLYQCTTCVFMHRIPVKVIQHFRFKHDAFKLYRCGHCDYASRDSQRIYRHCQIEHKDQEIRIIDKMSGKIYEGEECSISSIFPEELASLSVPDEIERLVKRYVLKKGPVQTCRICQHTQEGGSLRQHLLAIHLKYLPFRCKYCLFSAGERNKTIMHVRNSHSDMRVKIVRQKFKGILPELPDDDRPPSDDEVKEAAGNTSDNEDNTEEGLSVSRNSTPLNLPELSRQMVDSPVPEATQNDGSALPMQLRIESIGSVTEDGSTLLATDQLREEPQTYTFNADGEIVPVERRTPRRSGRRSGASLEGQAAKDAAESSSIIVTTDDGVVMEVENDTVVKPEPEYDHSRYGVMPEGASVPCSPPSSPQPSLMSVKMEPQDTKSLTPSSENTPRSSPEKSLGKDGQQRLKMCKYCTYKTQWNIADVKTHMLVTHMGKYPYGCKYCEFTGRDKKRLREHSAKFHPGRSSGFRYLFNDYGDMIYSEKVGNNVVIGITLLDNKAGPVPTYTKKVLNKPKPKKSQSSSEQNEPLDLSVPKPEITVGQTLGTAYSTSISTGPLSLKIKLGRESSSSPSTTDTTSISDITSSNQTPKDEPLPITGPAKHLQCKMCGYTHFDLYKLKTHILLKHCMLKPYACVYCDFEELTYHKAVRHVKESHADMPFRIRKILCEKDMVLRKKICKTDMNDARIKQQEEYRRQQMAFRKFRPFACRQCDYRTTTRAKVKYHSIRMHPGRPVQWIRLEKPEDGVNTEVKLAEGSFYPGDNSEDTSNAGHSKSYTLSLKCSKCNLVFSTDDSLQRHIMSEHSGKATPDLGFYHCVYCPSIIKHKNKTKFHMRMKHPDQPLVFNYVPESRGPRYHKAQKRNPVPVPQPAHNNAPIIPPSDLDPTLPPNIKKPRLSIPDWKIRLHASETATDLYKCRACKFTTRDQFVMRNHVQAHISYLPYCCPYCNYANVKSFPVKIHVAKVHPTEVVRFVLRRDDSKEEELKQLYTRPAYLRRTPSASRHSSTSMSLPTMPPLNIKQEPGMLPDELPFIPPDIPPPMDPKKVKKPTPFSTYKCVLCGAITKNHTGIKRHLMWELRYLPYMCPCCPFKCAHRFGAEKHCRSKHGVDNPEVILGHNPEREAHIANLIRQSRVPKNRGNNQNSAKKVVPPPVLESNSSETMEPGFGEGLPKPRPSTSTSSNITKKYMKRYQSSKFRKANAGKAKRCTLCGFTTSIFKTMVNHVVRHGPKRYGCNHCDYEGFFRYEVVKHMFKFHPELPNTHRILDNPRLDPREVVRDVNDEELEREAAGLAESTPDEPGVTSSGVSPSKAVKPGGIMVDGMEIDPNEVYMDPHGEHYLCRHCTYVSRSKDHWKNHVIKHISPRWQCGHCKMQGQVSYDLRKHIRQKHPSRGMKMFKIDPLTGNNHSFGGKLVIRDGGPRWRDIETNIWYGGSQQGESGMSVTIKQEIPSNMETGLSSYSPGTLAFNCYYCTFKTHDPVMYAEHIRSHTARRGDDDTESHSISGSQLSSNVEVDNVPHLGQAYVQLFDILKIGDDELANILAENGVATLK